MSGTLIQVLKKGTEYLVDTSDRAAKKTIHIVFCHKDNFGIFQHGVTSEGILQMMISRYQHLIEKDDSTENIRALLFLRQALEAVQNRNFNKLKRRNDSSGDGLSVSSGGESGRQQIHPGAETTADNSIP